MFIDADPRMLLHSGERVCDRSSDCSHYCHDAPVGSICYCPSHLHLQPDKMTCLESHPCEAWGVCSQLCQPLKYGHKCLCEKGYKLQHDGFTCKSTGNVSLTMCMQFFKDLLASGVPSYSLIVLFCGSLHNIVVALTVILWNINSLLSFSSAERCLLVYV
jgi:hypothetical protein